MLKPGKTYDEIYGSFKWVIPDFFNMGVDVCDKWAHQRYRLALIYEDEKGQVEKYTFWDLKRLSNGLANGLKANGIEPGDRVGILLPQSPEAGITHIAVYKMGAVVMPLFTLFGPEALEYRLNNSQAAAVVTDEANLHKILEIRDNLTYLRTIVLIRAKAPDGILSFDDLVEKGSSSFQPLNTRADDPAFISYTSGTTGPPKGAYHAHRVLLGHLPGIQFPHNFFPKEDDLFWTPADWAWMGGFMDALLPSWHYGTPVFAHRARKFDPEEVFHLLAKYGIRNAFMPPTALKMMRQVKDPKSRHDYAMRTIGSGGESLGEELLAWGKEVMGLTINEFYGQTEVNLVVGSCSEVMEIRPGSMGKAIPGHMVEVVDASGNPMPPGEVGEVGIKRPDPVMCLGYWKNPEATRDQYVGDWWVTGDLAKKDEDGYFWFVGRKDDLITSSGYRIGPAEIEDCLMGHPSVGLAAVVGSPDPVRHEVVKAFIVPDSQAKPGPELAADIKNFVKVRLAAHEYPREIEFVSELPMTNTGKIIRRELKAREVKRKRGQSQ
ncbi:MAG: AMP-binding protein [Deltaproteobacteria bacterium]|jgi:acetyl-CoA synthetase|nr:AMP-binding protein [Deltaproteobacteria bacterium]